MSNDSDKAATKADLDSGLKDMRNFILDRESSLIWKVLALQVALIGAIAGGQWAALLLFFQHIQFKP